MINSTILSPQMELWIMFSHSNNELLRKYLNKIFDNEILDIMSKSCNDNFVEFVGTCIIKFFDGKKEEVTIILSNEIFRMKRKKL